MEGWVRRANESKREYDIDSEKKTSLTLPRYGGKISEAYNRGSSNQEERGLARRKKGERRGEK